MKIFPCLSDLSFLFSSALGDVQKAPSVLSKFRGKHSNLPFSFWTKVLLGRTFLKWTLNLVRSDLKGYAFEILIQIISQASPTTRVVAMLLPINLKFNDSAFWSASWDFCSFNCSLLGFINAKDTQREKKGYEGFRETCFHAGGPSPWQ